jgi:hypothetical protein
VVRRRAGVCCAEPLATFPLLTLPKAKLADTRKPNEPLPPLLNDFADLIGREAALKLAEKVGGTRIYIPMKNKSTHWLSKLIGRSAAIILSRSYGGDSFEFPLGPHANQNNMRPRIVTLRDLKLSPKQIARALNITERTVWRHLSSERAATKTITTSRKIPA